MGGGGLLKFFGIKPKKTGNECKRAKFGAPSVLFVNRKTKVCNLLRGSFNMSNVSFKRLNFVFSFVA